MGRAVRRYGWVTALGAVLGFGWWLWLAPLPEALCEPADFGCGTGVVVVLAPVLPLVSWLAAWFALHRLHVDRPGVTGASGVGVAVLLTWMLNSAHTPRDTVPDTAAVPLPVWLVGLGAVSFLIGGMLSAGPVCRE